MIATIHFKSSEKTSIRLVQTMEPSQKSSLPGGVEVKDGPWLVVRGAENRVLAEFLMEGVAGYTLAGGAND